MEKYSARKPNRLKGYDYSSNGSYFITICTKNKECVLGIVVGDGVLDVPKMRTSRLGKIVDECITEMANFYENVTVEKYIVMPNHVHLLISINNGFSHGTSRTPSPTNSTIPQFVSTLKRIANKRCGYNLWQRSYYDHIIRNEFDFLNTWEYINSNTQKWKDDRFYIGD